MLQGVWDHSVPKAWILKGISVENEIEYDIEPDIILVPYQQV